MISAALLAVLLAAAPAPKLLEPGVWRSTLVTASGAELALYRYVPAVPRTGGPVLLVPELGFTRDVFDLDGFGLAPWLQERGREVFVLEPRGHGASSDGGPAPRLSQIALEDVPAALDAVGSITRQKVDLVVHGYGGSLALAALTGRTDVGKVVALASPFEAAVPNRPFEEALEDPSALGEDASRFEFLFARRAEVGWRRLRTIRVKTGRPLPASMRADWLAWARTGDLPLGADSVKRRLEHSEVPTLIVLPLLDYFVHPEHSAPLRAVRPETVEVRLLSKLYLHHEDYTHLSVLLGEGAPQDVFAPALKFLETTP